MFSVQWRNTAAVCISNGGSGSGAISAETRTHTAERNKKRVNAGEQVSTGTVSLCHLAHYKLQCTKKINVLLKGK